MKSGMLPLGHAMYNTKEILCMNAPVLQRQIGVTDAFDGERGSRLFG